MVWFPPEIEVGVDDSKLVGGLGFHQITPSESAALTSLVLWNFVLKYFFNIIIKSSLSYSFEQFG